MVNNKGSLKYSIKDCKKAAKNNNGKCLSKEYISTKTKYLWECEEGHQWEARFDNILIGQWCPCL